MPERDELQSLGAREREIIEVLFRLGVASVADVRTQVSNPPTYSAVRGMLGLLEQKALVTHKRDGLRYVYSPTMAHGKARRRALKQVVATFFSGSPERAVSALLGIDEDTPIDLAKIRAIIAKEARKS